MKVVYHRGALRDLAAIRDYIARDDPVAAQKVIARIEKVANHLSKSSYIGRPGPRGARLLSVARLPYVVIPRIRGDAVSIVAIFHTARNRKF
jgi:plasmid stabilization system protein ParE